MFATLEPEANTKFYVTGGTLRSDAQCYLVREADQTLYEALRNGDFAYVLTSRQMGKSSLMVRTASRLRKDGFAVVIADLSAIGQNLDADQWYYGLAEGIGAQLGLSERRLTEIWNKNPHHSSLQRWTMFLEELRRENLRDRLVIFIDEIDLVRSLPFSTDEFFAAIRHLYNRRATDSDFERLTFCLLGVAAPAELIANPLMTPFNIGTRIELNDFTEAEAAPLAVGLGGEHGGLRTLSRVLHWTGGHPYLTQRLCQAVVDQRDSPQVDEVCKAVFLGARSRENDDNLAFVRERMLHDDLDTAALLNLYGRIRRGYKVPDSESSKQVTVLRLSGLCRARAGYLQVRNRIYARVFDRHWIKISMPDAELRRQRVAFRRGFLLASGVAVAVLAMIATLIYTVASQRDEIRRQLYIANIGLAQQSWKRGDISRAVELLRRAIPEGRQTDLRGFEWYSLWNLCRAQRPVLAIPVPNMRQAGLSLDGQRIFVATDEGVVELDAETGKRIASPTVIHAELNFVSSPDGTRLATVGSSGVAVFDLRSGTNIRPAPAALTDLLDEGIDIKDGAVLSFLPDGGSIISSAGSSVISWLVQDMTPRVVHRASETIRRIAVARNGKYVAFSTRTMVELWSADFSKRINRLPANQPDSLAFCPDANCLAWGDYGPIRIFDIRTGRMTELKGHRGFVEKIAFSPDGRQLASSGQDNVRVWDVQSGREVRSFGRHAGGADLVFFPDGKKLLATGADGIEVWDLKDPVPEMKAADEVYTVAFSPDGRFIASGGNDGELVLWNTATRTRSRALHVGERIEYTAYLDTSVVIINTRHHVMLWDLFAGKPIAKLAESPDHLFSALSPDRKSIAIADAASREVSIVDLSVRNVKLKKSLHGTPVAVAFAANDNTLVVSLDLGKAEMFSAAATFVLQGPPFMSRALTFSPVSSLLMAGYDNSQLYVWDWHQRKKRALLEGHYASIKSLQFSPDRTRLVSASDDGTVRLWDAVRFEPMLTFDESDQSMEAVAFSPDSRFLAAAGDDRRIRLWDGSPTDPNRHALDRAVEEVVK